MSSPFVMMPADELLERLEELLDRRFAEHTTERAPALLDRRGIALALCVGVDTIDKLRRQGMPTVMVIESPRFELDRCLEWLRGRPA